MLGPAIRTADLLLMGFLAYGALVAGFVVLLAYGGEEIAISATLVAGGFALAAVHLWAWRRSGDRRTTGQTRTRKSEG